MWWSLNRISLAALLMLATAGARAQLAEFQQGVLTLPEIVSSGIAYRAEFRILPDSDPMRFELIASSTLDVSGSLLAATFQEGVLRVPEALVGNDSYWLEFENNGNNIFTLTDWGQIPPTPVAFHPAPGNPGDIDPIWQRLPGFAYDIGIGANGAVWVIGTDPVPGGFGIYNLNSQGGFAVEGGAIRIDVDPQGNPWIVNFDHHIYRWVNGFWQRMPGEALDIGIGAEGSVWVASFEGIYFWNGLDWINAGGSASRIDVGPNGQPWVLGFSDRIYTLIDGFWQQLPGEGGDIGVGADGSVWLVAPAEFGWDGLENPRGIFRWNGFDWERVYGDAIDISVGPDGMPWVTNMFAELYRGFQ